MAVQPAGSIYRGNIPRVLVDVRTEVKMDFSPLKPRTLLEFTRELILTLSDLKWLSSNQQGTSQFDLKWPKMTLCDLNVS